MSKTGKVIRKAGKSEIIRASPDDPLYKRGWIVGVKRSSSSSSSTQGEPSREKPKTWAEAAEEVRERRHRESGSPYSKEEFDKDIEDFIDYQLPQEFREQMGAPPSSEKTEQSRSTTGQKSRDSKH